MPLYIAVVQIVLFVVSSNSDKRMKNNRELLDLQVYYAVSKKRRYEK
jgi:hypothetical protein